MNLAHQYADKVRYYLERLKDLESEYHDRWKSPIYLEKRRQYRNAAQDYKDRLLRLGRDQPIVVVQFDLGVEQRKGDFGTGVLLYRRYETYLVGVNEEMAEELIKLENSTACNFTYETIEAGILKEI